MAPQLVGQRLKRFMDGRGFDLEDLLGLSLLEFKIFLKDPEFCVDNVQILFLLRDWKEANIVSVLRTVPTTRRSMAPQPVGQRLKHFMDDHGFDLEDLLGLSLVEFKIFLKDPEFGVDNVQILFLLRDWKKANIISVLSIIAKIQNSVQLTTKQVRSGPSSAEENSDRDFITDIEATSCELRPKSDPCRSTNFSATDIGRLQEENSDRNFITDIEATSYGELRPSKSAPGRSTNSSAKDIGRLQPRVREFGDAASYQETTLQILKDLILAENETKIRVRETHEAAGLELSKSLPAPGPQISWEHSGLKLLKSLPIPRPQISWEHSITYVIRRRAVRRRV